MQDRWTIGGVADPERSPAPQPRRRLPWQQVLVVVVGLVGVAALAATAWSYAATQRELVRLATDVAQLRLSLDLYTQQRASGSGPTAETGATDPALLDLSNRLAILEESWRGNASNAATPAAAPASTALPALPGSTTTTAEGGDCLPTGTRFMVAAGDSYPVCGSTALIEIGAVDNGFITLADGTVVAQGGNIALPGTGCMLGVVPSDGGSLSGFAEIRVTC